MRKHPIIADFDWSPSDFVELFTVLLVILLLLFSCKEDTAKAKSELLAYRRPIEIGIRLDGVKQGVCVVNCDKDRALLTTLVWKGGGIAKSWYDVIDITDSTQAPVRRLEAERYLKNLQRLDKIK